MNKSVAQQNRLLQQLVNHKSNWSLPQDLYLDEEIFNADLENIFYSEWIFVGHDCEIPMIGDYIRYEIGQADVILLRDEGNKILAFENTCRHRGSRLCKEDKGNKSQLVCPYHQWTYDLSGQLKYAKDMGDDFNPKDHKLHRVHCETIQGVIYICLSNQVPDFEEFRKTVEPYLAVHNLYDAKVVHESNIIEEGNWKLVIENNRECYHCAGSHPELCRTYSDDPAITGIQDELDSSSDVVKNHWEKCEALGVPSKFHLSADGQYRITRMPLNNESESFTMNGVVASNKKMVETEDKALGTLLFFHYPNSWNHFLSDHAITFRVTPISSNKTMVTTKWLVHKEAEEGVDYDIDSLTAVWKATNQQDLELVEENHKGIRSPNYKPGPYSLKHEDGVIQFINWYHRVSIEKATQKLNDNINDQKLMPEKYIVSEAAVKTDQLTNYKKSYFKKKTNNIKNKRVNNTKVKTKISSHLIAMREYSQEHHTKKQKLNISKSFDQNKIPYLYLDQSQPWEAQSSLLELINIVPETHDVVTYSFRTPTSNWFSFAPGQFITLELPMGEKPEYRTYTISSSPSRPLSLSITVKINEGSIGSKWMLENLELGMKLRAFGPVGEFNLYKHTAEKYCFISGGSGITPMISMTKYLFDRGGDADISFIHCAKSPSNIIAKDELERLSMRVPSIQVNWIVAEKDPFSVWTGYTGRINQLILELTTPDFFEREIFCCGPEMFMKTVRDILNAVSFDMTHYHEESYDKPILEENAEIEKDSVILDENIKTSITFLDSELTIDSNQSISILDTSLKAGLNIPSACQFGVCGTCKVMKKSGNVHMVHNGGISDKEIAEGYILACCSHPLNDVQLNY